MRNVVVERVGVLRIVTTTDSLVDEWGPRRTAAQLQTSPGVLCDRYDSDRVAIPDVDPIDLSGQRRNKALLVPVRDVDA